MGAAQNTITDETRTALFGVIELIESLCRDEEVDNTLYYCKRCGAWQGHSKGKGHLDDCEVLAAKVLLKSLRESPKDSA